MPLPRPPLPVDFPQFEPPAFAPGPASPSFPSQEALLRRLDQVAREARIHNLRGLYERVVADLQEYIRFALHFDHAGVLIEMGTAASCHPDPNLRGLAVIYLNRAVRILEEQPESVRGPLPEVLADRALAELGRGELEASRRSYRRAYELAQKQLETAQAPEDRRRGHTALARVLRPSVLFSLPSLAVQKLEEGLGHARKARSRREEAASLNNLGVALTHQRQLDRAWSCFLESQALFEALDLAGCTDLAWNNLGILALLRRQPEEALRSFQKGREAAGDGYSASVVLRGNEAVALFQVGRTTEGIDLLWKTLAEAQRMKDPLYVEDLRHNLARCFIESGAPAAAIEVLENHPPRERPAPMESPLNQARHAAILLEAYDKAAHQDKLAASPHLVEQARYFQTARINDREARPYDEPWVPQLMTLC